MQFKIKNQVANTFRVPRQYLSYIAGPSKHHAAKLYIHGKTFNVMRKSSVTPTIRTNLRALSNIKAFIQEGKSLSDYLDTLPNSIIEPIQSNVNEFAQYGINEDSYRAVPLNTGKLLLYLCSLHPDENGIIRSVNIEDTAAYLNCCELTVYNALDRLKEDRLISYSKHYIQGHITLMLCGSYKDCYIKDTPSNGYIRMFREQLSLLMSHDHSRDLRLEVRTLLQSEIDYNIFGHLSILNAEETKNCYSGAKKSYTYDKTSHKYLKTVSCIYTGQHIIAQPTYTHKYYLVQQTKAKNFIRSLLVNKEFNILADHINPITTEEQLSSHALIQQRKENILRQECFNSLVNLYLSYGEESFVEAIKTAQLLYSKSDIELPFMKLVSSVISNSILTA